MGSDKSSRLSVSSLEIEARTNRDEIRRLREENARLRQRVEGLERAPCGCPVPDCQHHRGLVSYQTWRERAEAAEAKLAKVVEVLLANRDSADRCLNEPNHPAWVHAQAHATISVCDTALAAAKGE